VYLLVFTHILTKCTIQDAKSPVKISSGSVAQRDLIPGVKGLKFFLLSYFCLLCLASLRVLSLRFAFQWEGKLKQTVFKKKWKKKCIRLKVEWSSLMWKCGLASAGHQWGMYAYTHWDEIPCWNQMEGKRIRALSLFASSWIDGRHFILTFLPSVSPLSLPYTNPSELNICHLTLSLSLCLSVLLSWLAPPSPLVRTPQYNFHCSRHHVTLLVRTTCKLWL
jgi:hypothetical protein